MHAVVISPIQYHSAGQIKFPQDKRPIYQMFSKSTFTVNFLSSISASATMRRYVHHVESETVSATMVSAQWTVYYTLSPLFRDQPLTPHREYENVIPETGRRSPSLVHMHTKYLPTILFKINLHPLFVKRQMPCDYVLCVSIQHSANRLTYNSICIYSDAINKSPPCPFIEIISVLEWAGGSTDEFRGRWWMPHPWGLA